MFHIVALVVLLNHPLVYTGAGPFADKPACETFLASDAYKTAVDALKQALVIQGIESEVTSSCEAVE